MSFGYGVADALTLIQIAWKTVDGARRACGEHSDLAKEVSSLHTVLEQLQAEISNPDSLVNRSERNRRSELQTHMVGCEKYLRTLDSILTKYNTLGDEERSTKKLWQKIRFGNGEVMNLAEIRLKISTYTMAITMSLNLMLLGSQGRVERRLGCQDGDLEGIRESVNLVLAKLTSQSREDSVMTDFTNDDKHVWRGFRRELVEDGYPSTIIRRHKHLIQDYVKELGARNVLDDPRNRSRLSLATSSSRQETWRSASAGHNQSTLFFVTVTTHEKAQFSETSFSISTSPGPSGTSTSSQDLSILSYLPTGGLSDRLENPILHANLRSSSENMLRDDELEDSEKKLPLEPEDGQIPDTDSSFQEFRGKANAYSEGEDIPPDSNRQSAVKMGKRRADDSLLSQSDTTTTNNRNYEHSRKEIRESAVLRDLAFLRLRNTSPAQPVSKVAEMVERLAFLERLTVEQGEMLEAAKLRQHPAAEERDLAEVIRATEVRAASRPLESVQRAASR